MRYTPKRQTASEAFAEFQVLAIVMIVLLMWACALTGIAYLLTRLVP